MSTNESELKLFGLNPMDAVGKLEGMDYDESKWDEILKQGSEGMPFGSHIVRALITVARGKETRLISDVLEEIRQKDNLPPR